MYFSAVLQSERGYYKDNKKFDEKNQILLKAEPQIGKTGVFLRVISLLRKTIDGN